MMTEDLRLINIERITYDECRFGECLDDLTEKEQEDIERKRLLYRLWRMNK